MVVAYQAPGDADRVPSAPGARVVVERFVRLIEHQDLAGVAGLYASGATWEVHIPSWDGPVTGPTDFRELHEIFFGREELRVDRHQIVEEADRVGLCWDLSWRDRDDGAWRVSFQSHFFEVAGELPRHDRMYCGGVRAVD